MFADCQTLFAFDNAACHCSYSADVLIAFSMNLRPGGHRLKNAEGGWCGLVVFRVVSSWCTLLYLSLRLPNKFEHRCTQYALPGINDLRKHD